MSHPRKASSADEYIPSANADSQDNSSQHSFAARLRRSIDKLGVSDAEIARRAGISSSGFNRYTSGRGMPGAEQLFAIADVLCVSARWLLSGSSERSHLADADQAEWVEIPEYDLRELSDDTRGHVVSRTPIRKDWLSKTLNQSSGLWLARLPADLARYQLHEGDLVFLRDVEPGEAQDGAVYIVRIWGHLTVARIDSMLMNRMNTAEGNVQDRAIAPRDIGTEDGQAILVARVLGAPLRRL